MNIEPTYQGQDVFLCPKNKSLHRFFQDNYDTVTSWNVQNFLGHYPSDLQPYLDGLEEIKSYKVVAGTIRNYCVRQLDFLGSLEGIAHVRVLRAQIRTRTNTKIIQENYVNLSQQETIAQQDSVLNLGQKELHTVPMVSSDLQNASGAQILGSHSAITFTSTSSRTASELPNVSQNQVRHFSYTRMNEYLVTRDFFVTSRAACQICPWKIRHWAHQHVFHNQRQQEREPQLSLCQKTRGEVE